MKFQIFAGAVFVLVFSMAASSASAISVTKINGPPLDICCGANFDVATSDDGNIIYFSGVPDFSFFGLKKYSNFGTIPYSETSINLGGISDRILGVDVDENGDYFTIFSSGNLKQNNSPILNFPPTQTSLIDLEVSNGKIFVIHTDGNTNFIDVYDKTTQAKIGSTLSCSKNISDITSSPDGTIYGSENALSAKIVNLSINSCPTVYSLPTTFGNLADLKYQNDVFYLVDSTNAKIEIHDTDFSLLDTINLSEYPNSIDVSPNGNGVIGTDSGNVYVFFDPRQTSDTTAPTFDVNGHTGDYTTHLEIGNHIR